MSGVLGLAWHSKLSNELRAKGYAPDRCEVCDGLSHVELDHDHETGVCRGWLCPGCNTLLGQCYGHWDWLEKAIRQRGHPAELYLRFYCYVQGVAPPPGKPHCDDCAARERQPLLKQCSNELGSLVTGLISDRAINFPEPVLISVEVRSNAGGTPCSGCGKLHTVLFSRFD